jgi:hypothetical protein
VLTNSNPFSPRSRQRSQRPASHPLHIVNGKAKAIDSPHGMHGGFMFNNKNEVTKVLAPAICPVSMKEEIEKVQKTYDDLIQRFFCIIGYYNYKGYTEIDYTDLWTRRFESYISMKEAEAKTRAERARIREIVKDIMTEIDVKNEMKVPGIVRCMRPFINEGGLTRYCDRLPAHEGACANERP